jgi:hypothetical protein
MQSIRSNIVSKYLLLPEAAQAVDNVVVAVAQGAI